MTPLAGVASIGNWFLYNCTALTELKLPTLTGVATIGYYFLSSCKKLTELDLSPLSGVTAANSYFLSGCNGLTYVNMDTIAYTKISLTYGFSFYRSSGTCTVKVTGNTQDWSNWFKDKASILVFVN
jgi:hypothetical protein